MRRVFRPLRKWSMGPVALVEDDRDRPFVHQHDVHPRATTPVSTVAPSVRSSAQKRS